MTVGFQKQPWYGGKIRRVPWWMRLWWWMQDKKVWQHRMWFVPGPLNGKKPDQIKGGYWQYFE